MGVMVAREAKSARTRRRILDAAAEVFSEQGYTARLSDIADRAEMKAGSLYYHFDSREDLVAEVLRLGIDGAWDQVAGAVGRLPSAATPLERLETAIRAHTLSIVGRSAYATAQTRIVGSLPPDLARGTARTSVLTATTGETCLPQPSKPARSTAGSTCSSPRCWRSGR